MKHEIVDLEKVSNHDVEIIEVAGAAEATLQQGGAPCCGGSSKQAASRWREARLAGTSPWDSELEDHFALGSRLDAIERVTPVELPVGGTIPDDLRRWLLMRSPFGQTPQPPGVRRGPRGVPYLTPDVITDDRGWRSWLGVPAVCPLPVPFSSEEQAILRDIYDAAESQWPAPMHAPSAEGLLVNPKTGVPWLTEVIAASGGSHEGVEYWGGPALQAYILRRNSEWAAVGGIAEAAHEGAPSEDYVRLRRKITPHSVVGFLRGNGSARVRYLDISSRGDRMWVSHLVAPWYRDPASAWTTCCNPTPEPCQWWEPPYDIPQYQVECADEPPYTPGNFCIRITEDLHARIEAARERATGHFERDSSWTPEEWSGERLGVGFWFWFQGLILGGEPGVAPIPELMAWTRDAAAQFFYLCSAGFVVGGVSYRGAGPLDRTPPYNFCYCRTPSDPTASLWTGPPRL